MDQYLKSRSLPIAVLIRRIDGSVPLRKSRSLSLAVLIPRNALYQKQGSDVLNPMLNTLFNRKTSIRIRLFASFLIFTLAPSPLERFAIAGTAGADLCVCPGSGLHATTGAVCPYADLQAALGYAQQPQQRPPAPQQRIPIEETTKANTSEPSGPRAARPELVLQTGVSRPAFN